MPMLQPSWCPHQCMFHIGVRAEPCRHGSDRCTFKHPKEGAVKQYFKSGWCRRHVLRQLQYEGTQKCDGRCGKYHPDAEEIKQCAVQHSRSPPRSPKLQPLSSGARSTADEQSNRAGSTFAEDDYQVFVGGLPKNYDEEELREGLQEALERYGKIVKTTVCSGFAFVTFATVEAVDAATTASSVYVCRRRVDVKKYDRSGRSPKSKGSEVPVATRRISPKPSRSAHDPMTPEANTTHLTALSASASRPAFDESIGSRSVDVSPVPAPALSVSSRQVDAERRLDISKEPPATVLETENAPHEEVSSPPESVDITVDIPPPEKVQGMKLKGAGGLRELCKAMGISDAAMEALEEPKDYIDWIEENRPAPVVQIPTPQQLLSMTLGELEGLCEEMGMTEEEEDAHEGKKALILWIEEKRRCSAQGRLEKHRPPPLAAQGVYRPNQGMKPEAPRAAPSSQAKPTTSTPVSQPLQRDSFGVKTMSPTVQVPKRDSFGIKTVSPTASAGKYRPPSARGSAGRESMGRGSAAEEEALPRDSTMPLPSEGHSRVNTETPTTTHSGAASAQWHDQQGLYTFH